MKSLRFVLASCILVAVSNALVMPAHAGNTYTGADFAWPDSPGIGHLGLYIDDDISHTRLMSTVRTQSGQLCTSLNDAACANQSLRTYSILPRCETDVQKDCVESLGATTSQGVASEGVFSRYFPEQGLGDFEGNPGMNIPTGAAPSIFTISGARHSAGDEYMVIASVGGFSPYDVFRRNLTSLIVHASVYPVKVLSGNFSRNVPSRDSAGVNHESDEKWGNCASIADGYCAARQDFPTNTKFSLSLRLSTAPKGWLHGRIFSPSVTYETVGESTRLKVEAEPVQVAAVATWGKYSDLPSAAKSGSMGCSASTSCGQMNPQSSGAQTAVDAWRSVYGDKASWVRRQWMYQTIADWDITGKSLSSCTTGTPKFYGFVTTNATGYAAGPPVFNAEEKSLSYVVASPHVNTEGELIIGTYDLMMRSDLASCLYGANGSDIVGRVSVLYDSVTSTTTDMRTEVTNDGTWFKVSASGFHYSMPSIKTTLRTKSEALAEPISSSQPGLIMAQRTNNSIRKSISLRALAARVQLTISQGDVLSIRVLKGSQNKCVVVRQSLRIKKSGSCKVALRVESGLSRTRSRTVMLRVLK
jgi:hypothetical protein